MKNTLLGLAAAAAMNSAPLMAYEAGDFIARAGWARAIPDSDSGNFGGVSGNTVQAEDADSLGLTFTYMFTDAIGLGVLGSWPFTVDIQGDDNLQAAGKVGDVRAFPPTVTAQWHFNELGNFHPYLGAGFNYTYFFDESTTGALQGTNMELNDSWGYALEAGVDYTFDNDFLVSAQLWYIDMETHAKTAIGNADVEVNPTAFMLSLGKKF
jgi:outer membrane protein